MGRFRVFNHRTTVSSSDLNQRLKGNEMMKYLRDKAPQKQDNAIMIGDSLIDFKAANKSNIFFALRKTKHNVHLQNTLDCFMFEDFTDE